MADNSRGMVSAEGSRRRVMRRFLLTLAVVAMAVSLVGSQLSAQTKRPDNPSGPAYSPPSAAAPPLSASTPARPPLAAQQRIEPDRGTPQERSRPRPPPSRPRSPTSRTVPEPSPSKIGPEPTWTASGVTATGLRFRSSTIPGAAPLWSVPATGSRATHRYGYSPYSDYSGYGPYGPIFLPTWQLYGPGPILQMMGVVGLFGISRPRAAAATVSTSGGQGRRCRQRPPTTRQRPRHIAAGNDPARRTRTMPASAMPTRAERRRKATTGGPGRRQAGPPIGDAFHRLRRHLFRPGRNTPTRWIATRRPPGQTPRSPTPGSARGWPSPRWAATPTAVKAITARHENQPGLAGVRFPPDRPLRRR